MEKVKQTLQAFADFTKHKDHELDTLDGLKLLTKKYLALQICVVPWRQVYEHVSHDADRLLLRVGGNANMDTFRKKPVDPQFFTEVMKFTHNGNVSPVFNHFCDTVLPRPVNEEMWETLERPDRWKDKAYFLALNFRDRSNYRDVLSQIYGTDSTDNAFETMYQNMLKYNVVSEKDTVEVAVELANMINDMEFNLDKIYVFPTTIQKQDQEQEHEQQKSIVPIKMVFSDLDCDQDQNQDQNQLSESDLRNHSLVKQYKTLAKLTRQFPSKKAVQQIIISNICSSDVPVKLLSHIMGKRQTKLEEIDVSPTDWRDMLSIVDKSSTTVFSKQQKDFYAMLGAVIPTDKLHTLTSTQFIKCFITVLAPHWEGKWNVIWPKGKIDRPQRQQINRYLKMYPKDINLVKEILMTIKT